MSLVFYPRLWLWPHPHLNNLQAHSELLKMSPSHVTVTSYYYHLQRLIIDINMAINPPLVRCTCSISASLTHDAGPMFDGLSIYMLCHAIHAWPGWHALYFIANGLGMPWDRTASARIRLSEDANTDTNTLSPGFSRNVSSRLSPDTAGVIRETGWKVWRTGTITWVTEYL